MEEKCFYDILSAENQAELDYGTLKFLILEQIVPFEDLLILVSRQFTTLS